MPQALYDMREVSEVNSTTSQLKPRSVPRVGAEARVITVITPNRERAFHGVQREETSPTLPLAKAWLEERAQNRVQSWLGRFVHELKRFARLPEDWNSYGSSAPNARAINAAMDVLSVLWQRGFSKPTSIGPMADGGVIVSFLGANAS